MTPAWEAALFSSFTSLFAKDSNPEEQGNNVGVPYNKAKLEEGEPKRNYLRKFSHKKDRKDKQRQILEPSFDKPIEQINNYNTNMNLKVYTKKWFTPDIFSELKVVYKLLDIY